ncbi:MAG: aminopeptidase P family protein [Ammonifex sp.]|jgi:Xaa-Pro aminopeptidase|nr:MAG: aminopeptidase P family protein [Ammonifex sp.]
MNAVLAAEVGRRVEGLQALLLSQGLTGALIVQSADVVYYTGTYQNGHLYVPVEGKPVFMVRRDFERARESAAVESIVPLKSYRDIPRVISEHGLTAPEKLGLEFDVLPVNVYLQYGKVFPAASFVDISPLIRQQRAVKSDYELEALAESGRLLDAMLAVVPRVAALGETELAMAGMFEGEARRLGHQGLVRFRGMNPDFFMGHLLTGASAAEASYFDGPVSGTGLDQTFAFGAGRRRLEPNEPLYVDYGAAYRSYITDATRVFVFGRLNGRLERAHHAALEIQAAVLDMVKPGVVTADLYDAAVRLAQRAGLAEYFQGWRQPVQFIGHGVGLELNELPVIATGVKEPLAAGMVFALEPKFVFPGEGAVGIENTIVVAQDGARRLTNFPDQIQHLS